MHNNSSSHRQQFVINSFTVYTCILLFSTILFYHTDCLANQTPRNPNSAKECAICHYRWIDTFFIDGKGTDLVPYQETKVVAEPGICFSCHDGSVADSRGKVYNDHRHPINKPPPPDMEIPAIFPLDDKGNMQCFTCHTAHGVSSEMGIERAVFIRTSNNDSSMCVMCHKGKEGGPAVGNHPIGKTKLTIPEELLRQGSVEGSDKNQIICQTCHTVHGSPFDNFLVANNRDSAELCLDCHEEKAGLLNTGHDLRRTAADAKNSKDQTPERSGICGACHLVHGAGKVALWARKLPAKSKNRTQDLCVGCHNKQGLAAEKLLTGYSHPVNISLKDKGMEPGLPVYDLKGNRVPFKSKEALFSCPTCHDPHQMGTARQAKMTPPQSSFLRVESGQPESLCKKCHVQQGRISGSDHDLRRAGATTKNTKGQSPRESDVCGVCHLVHGAQTKKLWARKVAVKSSFPAQDLCLTCHNDTGVAGKKVIKDHSHPVDIDPAKQGISTKLPLYDSHGKPGAKGVIACLTCHDPHQWNPTIPGDHGLNNPEGNARNSFLRLETAPRPILCANCHAAKAYVEKTDHDLSITAPAAKNIMGQTTAESGVCGACHSVHNAKNRVRLWSRDYGIGKGIMDRMCNSCHSETGSGNNKVPKVSTHPEKQLIANPGRNVKGKANYFPLFDDATGSYKTVGDIACASCHDVHHWDPKKKSRGNGKNPEGKATNSFLRMQTYNMICKDCHGLDSLFRFKYYHDSKKRKPAAIP
jgi:predicted CXXCH cytochrome family protein